MNGEFDEHKKCEKTDKKNTKTDNTVTEIGIYCKTVCHVYVSENRRNVLSCDCDSSTSYHRNCWLGGA